MKFEHPNLANGKWQSMTLAEQLGNVGSEVGRAINWHRQGNTEQEKKAAERALELLDLSLADARWQYSTLKEIARAREVFCDLIYGQNIYNTSFEYLNNYFMQFALLARKNI